VESGFVCCEDTRTTMALFRKYSIPTRGRHFTSFSDQHILQIDAALPTRNAHRALWLVENVHKRGKSVALVSEAGTPTISDPGAYLVSLAHRCEVPVFAIPGPCAVTSALSISGLSDKFIFDGFLPRKKTKKKKIFQKLLDEERTFIFFESPHRLIESLLVCYEVFNPTSSKLDEENEENEENKNNKNEQDEAKEENEDDEDEDDHDRTDVDEEEEEESERIVVVVRENTKLYEEVIRFSLIPGGEKTVNLIKSINPKGEFTVLISGKKKQKKPVYQERNHGS